MITIGIVSSQKSEIGNIIKNYILKRRKSVLFIENYNYKIIDSNRNNFNFVIYQINSDDILSNQVEWGEFDIILENISEDNEEEINALQKIIRSIKKGGYFIFNSDYINKINFKYNDLYTITYGLNERTTVTASSINDVEMLEFSYCLQRAILTLDGEVIQPFERPIKETGSSEDLFEYLSALTCMLVIGYKF